ncbi:MAG: carbohydrate ABC transporter permease [Alphaproteobacteria bacterium]|nr:carbohydrate ABC transporter permease [Alphaproteobacteria bacterium]
MLLGAVLAVWTLIPLYNILLIALSDEGDEFSGTLWPDEPSFDGFIAMWKGDFWYLEHFWHQFGNSLYIGLSTMVLTVALGSLASFAIGRMRLRNAALIGHASLLTYAVPASFLAIPFTHLMAVYGLADNLCSVIAAEVTFATPYAILVFHQYGKLIPLELDEAARVDGAAPLRIYLSIYLPLMAPALAAVATFALLMAWSEYQYQFLLLSSTKSMTVAVALDQFFDSDEAPWNYMMSIALVYSLPPIAVYYALRRYMVAGLTMGGVKG